MLVSVSLPFFETTFDIATDIKLLELLDPNQPLLKELVYKTPGTYHHSIVIGNLAETAAEAIGENPLLARVGAYYHDVGKIRIPVSILSRSGRLLDAEFEMLRIHPQVSFEILKNIPFPWPVAQMAYQHHERHDGSGYPEGLKGEAISQMGKMAAICDVYDAITSDRCYHKGLAPHEALRRIFEWSKFHFDPALVQQFLRTIGIYPVGTLVMLESGRIGVVLEQSDGSLLQPTVKVFYDGKRRQYLPPAEIDLSRSLGHGGGDRIVGHETPEKWGIDLSRFI
jgi:putative nucleotidyltransferase with HDIG domain